MGEKKREVKREVRLGSLLCKSYSLRVGLLGKGRTSQGGKLGWKVEKGRKLGMTKDASFEQ